METRTWTENGTPVSKEKTVAFSGHRTNRIAKFTADREKLFREVRCPEKATVFSLVTGVPFSVHVLVSISVNFRVLKE